MAGLIDNVIDVARGWLGGGLGVVPKPVSDLGEPLRIVIQEIGDTHLLREVVERLSIFGPVSCDRGRVQQLFSNLLGNALAH